MSVGLIPKVSQVDESVRLVADHINRGGWWQIGSILEQLGCPMKEFSSFQLAEVSKSTSIIWGNTLKQAVSEDRICYAKIPTELVWPSATIYFVRGTRCLDDPDLGRVYSVNHRLSPLTNSMIS